jgi:Mn2+/Fe2+ NRAMP family transporter
MIGGFMIADGFGLGSKPSDRAPRIMTTIALLTGMIVALAALIMKFDRTPTIIAAQAVTVVGAPLVAGVLFWLSSSKDVMGKHAAGAATKILAAIGLLLLMAMAYDTATNKLPKKVHDYLQKQSTSEAAPAVDNEPAKEEE